MNEPCPLDPATVAGANDVIEGLGRAIDWVKPEPGMDGPHGGHLGGVTRQKAVAVIEAAIEFIVAQRTVAGADEAWTYLTADIKTGAIPEDALARHRPLIEAAILHDAREQIEDMDVRYIAKSDVLDILSNRPHHDPTDHDCKGGVPGDLSPF